ncbi:MAG: aminotransferase [Cyclobacteriaceae bacterium]|nr:MAG: aminotransferase [Cyclobacteriaceae bacterium]
MISSPITIESKLPNIGTTIFTVMSAMAAEHDAINLSQGYPDFPISEQLIELVNYYMTNGYNQYAPMTGVPELRSQIANKLGSGLDLDFDPDREILVVAGATEGLYSALTAFVHPGDEVIIFDPAYDLYAPSVVLAGGIPVHLELELPKFTINWEQLESAVSSRTRIIVINNPNNPAGSILSRKDLDLLSEIVEKHDLLVISDEVYEHMVYQPQVHQSILGHPNLRERGIAIYSFGKTFHATGWKIGYCVGPQNLISELTRVHQFVAFSINTPIQMALADYLKVPDHYLSLADFFKEKRDLFLRLMKNSRFEPLSCDGTYFQLMRYDKIRDLPDFQMATWMTKEHGVASIPTSVFYNKGTDNKILRFCFAKNTETLTRATEKLCQI